MTTLTIAPVDPVATAPDRNRRGSTEPTDAPQGTALPWFLLAAAVALSLGSNVFAVLQIGPSSRSFGGVVYGAWPTTAFLAAAWLWHREGRRGGSMRGPWRTLLVWVLRLAVAVPAAYVSLLHVHATAMHFGQPGTMAWAEAIGMEAVTALALVELDAGHVLERLAVVDEGQDDEQDQADSGRARVLLALERDRATGVRHPARVYAAECGVSRQYVNSIIRDLEGATP